MLFNEKKREKKIYERIELKITMCNHNDDEERWCVFDVEMKLPNSEEIDNQNSYWRYLAINKRHTQKKTIDKKMK